jgi:hypothetical protein
MGLAEAALIPSSAGTPACHTLGLAAAPFETLKTITSFGGRAGASPRPAEGWLRWPPDAVLVTNVPLDAVSAAPDERANRDHVRELLQEDDGTHSIQVLQEFLAQAIRASRIAAPLAAAACAVINC